MEAPDATHPQFCYHRSLIPGYADCTVSEQILNTGSYNLLSGAEVTENFREEWLLAEQIN